MKARRLIIAAVLILGSVLGVGFIFRGRIIALLKPELERALSEATGYQVTFAAASFKVVPFIGLRLEDGNAISPEGCSAWRLGRVSVRVDLLPLLKKRLEIHRVQIEALDGALGLKDGSTFLVTDSGQRCIPSTRSEPSSPSDTIPPKDFSVSTRLDDIQILSGRLTIFGAEAPHALLVDELRASLAINKGTISLPELLLDGSLDATPFVLRAQNGAIDASRSAFSLPASTLSLGRQSLSLSGSYDGASRTGRGTVRAERIAIGQDEGLFVSGLPPVRGELGFSLDVDAIGDAFAVSGDARILRASASGSMSAEEVSLSSLRASFVGSSLKSASSTVLLRGFHCQDDRDKYSVDALRGELAVEKGTELSVNGGLEISNFGFSDEDTTIQRATAKLENIAGTVSPEGDVAVRLSLKASDIYLLNPNIEITSVSSVSAPLTISVPGGGGYSVAGPVTIANGEMSVVGKKLGSTGGTVEMSVASKLKTFSSSNLSTSSFGESLSAVTSFAMTHSEYTLSNTSISIGGGSIAASLNLGRHKRGPFSASADASNVSLPMAYRAVVQQESSPVRGTASVVSASVSGDSADIPGTISGSGSVRLSNAVFTTIDVQSLVQGAIASIPVVGSDITPSKGADPLLEGELSSSLAIGNSTASLPDLRVQFSNLTVEGGLKAGFDSSLNGAISLVYLEDTFRMLGFGITPLGNFLAREGRVAIPLKVSGTLSSPSVSPDMEAIGRFASGRDLVDSIRDAVGGDATSVPPQS